MLTNQTGVILEIWEQGGAILIQQATSKHSCQSKDAIKGRRTGSPGGQKRSSFRGDNFGNLNIVCRASLLEVIPFCADKPHETRFLAG